MKKTLNIILNVVIVLFVIFSVVITIFAFSSTFSDNSVPTIGGKVILTVQSPSMTPTFKEGDIIIGKVLTDEQSKELQVGDVITFKADLDGNGTKEFNTHRIISVDKSGGFVKYSTKGDNNQFQDSYTTYSSDVVCQWTGRRLAGLGNVLDFLQTPTGFLVCIVLPLVLFFGFELFSFIRTVVKVKNEGKRQITEDEEEEIKRKAVEEYLRQKAAEEAAAKKESEDNQPKE